MIQRKAYIKRSTNPIQRKSRPARVRRTVGAALEQIADDLWRKLVTAPGKCHLCGSAWMLDAAHGFARRFHGTRHDLRNGWCLCRRCHREMTDNPKAWTAFLRSELGDLYEPMRAKAHERTKPDYAAILAYLRGVR